MIGEETLFTGCELLKFSKDSLPHEDKIRLQNYTDFNILMSIINDKSGSLTYNISCAKQVLELLFPFYTIVYSQDAILFQALDSYELCGQINAANFLAFTEIIKQMFCLSKTAVQTYNVEGELAKKIADKFKKRQQKLAEVSNKTQKVAIFGRYISILTVGTHKDMNSFMKYTVYQLFDEFQRFELKMAYDVYFQARMAGAKDLKEPEEWMKDIHE